MTIWETMLATVPAILVGITMLVIVARSINMRIDDTNRRIDDLGTRLDKRLDDLGTRLDKRIDDLSTQLNNLQGMFMSIFGEEMKKIMKKKTGTDNT